MAQHTSPFNVPARVQESCAPARRILELTRPRVQCLITLFRGGTAAARRIPKSKPKLPRVIAGSTVNGEYLASQSGVRRDHDKSVAVGHASPPPTPYPAFELIAPHVFLQLETDGGPHTKLQMFPIHPRGVAEVTWKVRPRPHLSVRVCAS
jgi:hypothetical protein